MNLNQLKILYFAAKYGNLSLAAVHVFFFSCPIINASV